MCDSGSLNSAAGFSLLAGGRGAHHTAWLVEAKASACRAAEQACPESLSILAVVRQRPSDWISLAYLDVFFKKLVGCYIF